MLVPANDIPGGELVPSAIARSGCGENRWTVVENILEFTLTHGCVIILKPINTLQLTTRLDVSVADFFSANTQLSIRDKLALSIGVNPSRIKVVGFSIGSVIVQFEILTDPADSSLSEEEQIQQLQTLQ